MLVSPNAGISKCWYLQILVSPNVGISKELSYFFKMFVLFLLFLQKNGDSDISLIQNSFTLTYGDGTTKHAGPVHLLQSHRQAKTKTRFSLLRRL